MLVDCVNSPVCYVRNIFSFTITALIVSQSTTDMIANIAKKFRSSNTQADIIVQLSSYHKVHCQLSRVQTQDTWMHPCAWSPVHTKLIVISLSVYIMISQVLVCLLCSVHSFVCVWHEHCLQCHVFCIMFTVLSAYRSLYRWHCMKKRQLSLNRRRLQQHAVAAQMLQAQTIPGELHDH